MKTRRHSLCALVLTGLAGLFLVPPAWTEVRDVNVSPGSEASVGFQPTEAGQTNTLNLNNDTQGKHEIKESRIAVPDNQDATAWSRTAATANTHTYKISGLQEAVRTFAKIVVRWGGGGGGGARGGGGGLQDSIVNIPAVRFLAREGKINQGFDSTGDETGFEVWASTVKNQERDTLKLKIMPAEMADKIKLRVVQGDAGKVDITPKTFTEEETDLTLIGKNTTGEATIEAVLKSDETQVVARLKVKVFEERTVSVGFFKIADSTSAGTSPVGGAAADNITAKLNEVSK